MPDNAPLGSTALLLVALLGSAAAQPPAGDPERGRALLLQRHETGCILCHRVSGIAQGGDLGPPLAGIAQRLQVDDIRARIADARRFNPETLMPPYLSTTGLHAVAPDYVGKTLLTEQGLADIVAYLVQPPSAVPAAPAGPIREAPDGRR